jgi:hypothetical protein
VMNRSNTPITRVPRSFQTPQASATSIKAAQDDGLPAWMTEPKMVLYAIISVMCVIYQFYGWYSHRLILAATVPSEACISITSVANSGDAEEWHANQAKRLQTLGPWTLEWSQEGECLTQQCSVTHLKKVKNYIDGYLNHRVAHLNNAHRSLGKDGVELVQEVLKRPEHHEILNHARELLATKKISVGNFSREGQATYKLLVKHGNDNVPICYKPTKV